MKFRVTIFWNAPDPSSSSRNNNNSSPPTKKVWTMHGRQRAYQRELTEILPGSNVTYVPPVSILNAASFETIGEPEVCLENEKKGLMKWSCMYTASLMLTGLNVSNFPHDEHELVLKLGILRHRQPGMRWGKDVWKLGLATEADSRFSTRVPYGLLVDHVAIPEYSICERGLQFDIVPLGFGQSRVYGGTSEGCGDTCLQVKLRVRRDSGYYDQNIVPLLAFLNLVGTSALGLNRSEFGNRSQIIIATAFVEIGIRLSVDSKLPMVGYQIKLQWILNNFFYNLLMLNLESSFVYVNGERQRWKALSSWIDIVTVALSILHTAFICLEYYFVSYSKDRIKTKQR